MKNKFKYKQKRFEVKMKIFFTKRNKIMVLVILLAVIFFFGLKSYFKIDEQKPEEIEGTKPLALNWLSYTEGLALAENENKYVLIYFYTDWCSWCKKMDKEVFSDKEIIETMSQNFVSIRINTEAESKVVENGKEITERELAKLYQVSGVPAIWFLESDRKRIAPLPGYVAPQQFKIVLNYIGEGWYKSISFEEYLEKI